MLEWEFEAVFSSQVMFFIDMLLPYGLMPSTAYLLSTWSNYSRFFFSFESHCKNRFDNTTWLSHGFLVTLAGSDKSTLVQCSLKINENYGRLNRVDMDLNSQKVVAQVPHIILNVSFFRGEKDHLEMRDYQLIVQDFQ